ncbi:MAG: hypothetical protein JSV96_03525 [Candidatus Aminicenantes bacterium]|nr:MAG: hypothetical protein JSV96_03525 [Candidatus Aminicenantes bacterium]
MKKILALVLERVSTTIKIGSEVVRERKKRKLAVRGNKQKEGYEGCACPAS